jgi:hypothetical protein
MLNFLRGLFGPSGGRRETSPAEASVEYNGATITPSPEKVPGGWRLGATISKETEGQRRVHHLVRADTSPDREALVAMTLVKAKRLLDEQGDHLFHDA